MSFDISIWTEDDGVVKGVAEGNHCSWKFRLSTVDLIMRKVRSINGQHLLRLVGQAREALLEWRLKGQMRVKTRFAGSESHQVDIVAVVQLSNGMNVDIKLDNSIIIAELKLEFKWMHTSRGYLPDFCSGDTRLCFADGSVLRVHRALLAVFSSHMRSCLANMNPDAVVDMGATSVTGFKELLYHIYPTNRPVDVHFDLLSTTAVGFRVDVAVRKCGEYLLHTDRPLEEKFVTARNAPVSGRQRLISLGFDPALQLGADVYRNVICPAIIQAQSGGRIDWTQSPVGHTTSNEDEFTSVVAVQGSRFLVNPGVLTVHGTRMFGRGDRGEYIARIDAETARWAAEAGISVAALFECLVHYLLPSKTPIEPTVARPMLLLAHNHGMYHVITDIEEVLIAQERKTVEALLQALMDADRFELDNLRRACLLSIEMECSRMSAHLVNQLHLAQCVSEKTKQAVIERLCSGWAFCDSRLQTLIGDQRRSVKLPDDAGDTTHEITAEAAYC